MVEASASVRRQLYRTAPVADPVLAASIGVEEMTTVLASTSRRVKGCGKGKLCKLSGLSVELGWWCQEESCG